MHEAKSASVFPHSNCCLSSTLPAGQWGTGQTGDLPRPSPASTSQAQMGLKTQQAYTAACSPKTSAQTITLPIPEYF